MPKHRSGYSKKRKFYGNQYSKPRMRISKTSSTADTESQSTADTESTSDTTVPASTRKINLGNKDAADLNKNEVQGYRFINLEILGSIFKLLPCKECCECQLMLIEDDSQRMGCASCLSVKCSSCGWSEEFYTSEKIDHCFEIN